MLQMEFPSRRRSSERYSRNELFIVGPIVAVVEHQEDHLHVHKALASQEVAFQGEVLLFHTLVAAYLEAACPVVACPVEAAYLFHNSLGVQVVVPYLRRNPADPVLPSDRVNGRKSA
mmetsp:Transcript_19727/g.78456  ORF Transcript_19727/g.78456 Transcript_19727/m.78456 type:complete len:117 (-) Transcript_19727:55-405(-)